MLLRRPAVDALPFGVEEIDVSVSREDEAIDVVEATDKFFNFDTRLKNGRLVRGLGVRRISGYIQRRNLVRAHLDVVGLIEDRVVEGQAAGAVHANVAEADVVRRIDFYGVRER